MTQVRQHARFPELESLLARRSIGANIDILKVWPDGFEVERFERMLRAWTPMIGVLRDIAGHGPRIPTANYHGGYMNVLPEEITAEIKAALDIVDGGDGVIYG